LMSLISELTRDLYFDCMTKLSNVLTIYTLPDRSNVVGFWSIFVNS
jgi:hypothetical protein